MAKDRAEFSPCCSATCVLTGSQLTEAPAESHPYYTRVPHSFSSFKFRLRLFFRLWQVLQRIWHPAWHSKLSSIGTCTIAYTSTLPVTGGMEIKERFHGSIYDEDIIIKRDPRDDKINCNIVALCAALYYMELEHQHKHCTRRAGGHGVGIKRQDIQFYYSLERRSRIKC